MEYEKFLELDKKFEETGELTKDEISQLFGHIGQTHMALRNYVFSIEKIFHLCGEMCNYEISEDNEELNKGTTNGA